MTTNSSSTEETADEPSSKKPKLDVPVAKTFEVSDALRNGKDQNVLLFKYFQILKWIWKHKGCSR